MGKLYNYLREQRQPHADHQHPKVASDHSSNPYQTTQYGAELQVKNVLHYLGILSRRVRLSSVNIFKTDSRGFLKQ